MNAILVSVDYEHLLDLTLPYNRHHFERVMVVTCHRTAPEVNRICTMSNAEVFVTDAFYEDGAHFNKWKALELGLDSFGRSGWMCIMDADVLWPRRAHIDFVMGTLTTPMRRMCRRWDRLPPEDSWRLYPLHPQQREWAGYTQVFHCEDPVLPPPPWHQTDWKHAGGADSFFQARWSADRKLRPSFDVLHLGESGRNWCGVGKAKELQEMMAARRATRSYTAERL